MSNINQLVFESLRDNSKTLVKTASKEMLKSIASGAVGGAGIGGVIGGGITGIIGHRIRKQNLEKAKYHETIANQTSGEESKNHQNLASEYYKNAEKGGFLKGAKHGAFVGAGLGASSGMATNARHTLLFGKWRNS